VLIHVIMFTTCIRLNYHYFDPLPMVYRLPYPWYFDPLSMVYRPPYPWYIDPLTHGISTPLSMVFWPPTHRISTPYTCYFDLPAYFFIINGGGSKYQGGSIYHTGGQFSIRGSIYHGYKSTQGSIYHGVQNTIWHR
jgi:hypothetical protein